MIQFKWDKKSEWLLGSFEYLRADDLVAGAAVGTGPTFRTDQLAGGQHVPFAKLMSGTADDGSVIPGDSTNGLFVQVKASSLPTGASTEATLSAASAKLPATLGQKVMAASLAVSLASDQSPLAITDNSGSLTVDTPQLPASLGQKVATASMPVVLASDQGVIPVSDNSGSLTVDSGQLPATLGQKAMAASMAVVIASDQASFPVAGAKTNNGAVPGTDNLGVLPSIANATAPTRTEGNQGALRTTLSGDLAITLDSEAVVLGAGAATIGALTANQSVNAAQINGVTPLMGNGVTGTGSQRVTIASDNTAFQIKITDGTTQAAVIAGTTALKTDLSSVAGTATGTAAAGVQKVGIVGNANAAIDAATSAAVPANALHIGGKAATANPTNATAGNLTPIMLDKAGKPVVTIGAVRELVGNQNTVITASTAETTIVTAGSAGVFNDISCIVITTTNIAAAVITIKDATAGTTRLTLHYPPTAAAVGPLVIPFPVALAQAAAANNWTATVSVNAGAVSINVIYQKNL
jgi:hypothetical protein